MHDVHFGGTAPSGRHEDFHAVHLVFAATVPDGAEPRVTELDGTTDPAAWVPVADIRAGSIEVLDVVRAALDAAARRRTPGAERARRPVTFSAIFAVCRGRSDGSMIEPDVRSPNRRSCADTPRKPPRK